MLKKVANIEEFVICYDRLKKKGSIITNSFFTIKNFIEYFDKRQCLICVCDCSFFVLIPEYDFYEVQYYSLSLDDLSHDLNLLTDLLENQPIKIRVVTRNEKNELLISSFFENNGFEKKSRIIRLVSKNQGITKHLDVLKELVSATPSNLRNVGYALEDDSAKIKELLLTEFDPVKDSTPDVQEIKENIEKKQVIVVKDDFGNILCLRYFTVENGVCSLIYEVTHKDYRKLGLIYQIIIFFTEENKRNGVTFKRLYGWRNALKTNLLKFSKSMNEVPDGTVISVFFKD